MIEIQPTRCDGGGHARVLLSIANLASVELVAGKWDIDPAGFGHELQSSLYKLRFVSSSTATLPSRWTGLMVIVFATESDVHHVCCLFVSL